MTRGASLLPRTGTGPSQFLRQALDEEGEEADSGSSSAATNDGSRGAALVVAVGLVVAARIARGVVGSGGVAGLGGSRLVRVAGASGKLGDVESTTLGLDVVLALGKLNRVAGVLLDALLEGLLADEGVKGVGVVLEAGLGAVVAGARVLERVLESELVSYHDLKKSCPRLKQASAAPDSSPAGPAARQSEVEGRK